MGVGHIHSLLNAKIGAKWRRRAKIIFVNLFYYLVYFCYYLWVLLYFLVLFMGLAVLFQLIFTFIYSTFSKKFSVSAIEANLKQTFIMAFFPLLWQVYLLHKCNHVYPKYILLEIQFYFSLVWTCVKFFFKFKHWPLTWVTIRLRVNNIFFFFFSSYFGFFFFPFMVSLSFILVTINIFAILFLMVE